MVELLVTLLLAAVVIYVVQLIIGMINLPPQAKTIAYIVVAVIVILWLLDKFNLYHLG